MLYKHAVFWQQHVLPQTREPTLSVLFDMCTRCGYNYIEGLDTLNSASVIQKSVCSSVLPMRFKNSVSLAQHVHRVIAKNSLDRSRLGIGGEAEVRKDRAAIAGQVSPLVTPGGVSAPHQGTPSVGAAFVLRSKGRSRIGVQPEKLMKYCHFKEWSCCNKHIAHNVKLKWLAVALFS